MNFVSAQFKAHLYNDLTLNLLIVMSFVRMRPLSLNLSFF